MRGSKKVLGVLALVLVLISGYITKFGIYPRYFDIQWDEEVQLHDGRMTFVHVKRTFDRQGKRLQKYPKHPRQISMTFSFDAGHRKKFEHTFMRGTLNFLDEKDGNWYVGYNANPGDPSVEIGNHFIYPHVAILSKEGSIDKPKGWSDVPVEIRSANIPPATPNPQVISKFNDQQLTNAEKMKHWSIYPTGAGWGTIHRITPQPIN